MWEKVATNMDRLTLPLKKRSFSVTKTITPLAKSRRELRRVVAVCERAARQFRMPAWAAASSGRLPLPAQSFRRLAGPRRQHRLDRRNGV